MNGSKNAEHHILEWLEKCGCLHTLFTLCLCQGTESHSRCMAGKMAKAQGREGNVSSPADVLLPRCHHLQHKS